jgi:type I restriction enzyme, S subunit
VYVRSGGIPLISSKQLFQVDPVDINRLARGAHTKDMAEIALETNMVLVTRSGTIGRVQITPAYMHGWAGSEHATRLIAAHGMNPGYVYAWLASDYGSTLIKRHSYGSVILEIDKEMLGSVPIPIPADSVIEEIGALVMKANSCREKAWIKEREAISQLEALVAPA